MSTLCLDGEWMLRCPQPRASAPNGLRLERPIRARVPGTVHVALQRAKKIPDPFVGRNELELQWIDDQDWEFARELRASAADCACARQELVFDGLDTVCTIVLNGREVGRSENMFRQVVCDVRGVLVPGANRLELRFASPTRFGLERYRASGRYTDPGDFSWQTGERRETGRVWIRKTQCHFGWDWGLCLPSSGPWLTSRLECSDAPRLHALEVTQRHEGAAGAPTRVVLDLTLRVSSPVAMDGELAISWIGPETVERGRMRRDAGLRIDPARQQLAAGDNVLTTSIAIDDPQLWWPNGQGEQPLYELTVRFTDSDGERVCAIERRIGLRTIELVTEDDQAPDGKAGRSFRFRVNGRDVFIKGANWIPSDQFVDRCTPASYGHLLGAMRDAHMNLVRVWGGGWYELDQFYDRCDELGLLVWQDLMLACAPYPDTPAFIAELTAEARYQVQRLQHRACIALWCGDNEDMEGVINWWGKRPGELTRFWTMYRNLLSAVRDCVQAADPTRRFWISSPCNGDFDEHPNDPERGDVHYWAVWHGKLPFTNYLTVTPRFASEFGFQSFPEPRTIAACVAPSDRNPSSRVMEHHQRSTDGNLLITNTMARELPIPHGFDAFCWASQINQALAIRTAVEHWRRSKPWTMGTIYWQLNDCWPVASWSSIDWHGRWKALHHAATRFYAPLLASCTHRDGRIAVWATSDLAEDVQLGGQLEVMTWSGHRIARRPLGTRLAAGASRELMAFDVAQLLGGKAEPHEVCCFVELSAAGRGGARTAHSFLNLVPWKWASLPKPRLRAALRRGRDGGVELHLTTRDVAPFAFAELDGLEGHFAGAFDVLKPGTYRWPWVPHAELGARMPTVAEARRRLRVRSLYDLGEHA